MVNTKNEQTFTDKTTGQKEEQTENLSPGAQRGLSSAARAATNMILQYAWDGKKPEANDLAQAAVGAGEAFFLGHAINAVSEGNVLAGDSVALAASCASAVARVLLKNQDEKNKEANNGENSEDSNAPKRDHLEKATEVAFSLINSGVKFLASSHTLPRGGVAVVLILADIVRNGILWKCGKLKAGELLFRTVNNVASLGAGTVASACGTALITSCIGTAGLAAAMAATAGGAVFFAIGAFIAVKTVQVCKATIEMAKLNKRRKALLAAYDISKNISQQQFDSIRHKLQRMWHPDKGGSHENFVRCMNDLEELCALQTQCGAWAKGGRKRRNKPLLEFVLVWGGAYFPREGRGRPSYCV